MLCVLLVVLFVIFKQKTAYEMRISDWSSDVCSSDLEEHHAVYSSQSDEQNCKHRPEKLPGQRCRFCAQVLHGDSCIQPSGAGSQRLETPQRRFGRRRSEERRVGTECGSPCRSRW